MPFGPLKVSQKPQRFFVIPPVGSCSIRAGSSFCRESRLRRLWQLSPRTLSESHPSVGPRRFSPIPFQDQRFSRSSLSGDWNASSAVWWERPSRHCSAHPSAPNKVGILRKGFPAGWQGLLRNFSLHSRAIRCRTAIKKHVGIWPRGRRNGAANTRNSATGSKIAFRKRSRSIVYRGSTISI